MSKRTLPHAFELLRAADGERLQSITVGHAYAAALLDENRRLRGIIVRGYDLVDDFMRNIAHCTLQDYARLNRFTIDAGAIKHEDEQLAPKTSEPQS